MSARTNVPDKVEAFLLQVRHALFELIQAPDENYVVSVEAYDDVAYEIEGKVVAEQLKSSLSSDNPAANRAVPFWKTLYNWCGYLKEGKINPQKLKLIIVSEHKVTAGSIPQLFLEAETPEAAKEALQSATEILQRTAKGEKLASDECLPYIDYCLRKDNEEVMIQVIQLFTIDIHNGTYDETLRKRFNAQAILPEYKNELFIYMLGWVEEKVHAFTKENKPAFITKKEYIETLIREMRGFNVNIVLSAVSAQPDKNTKMSELNRHDTYIRQLNLINASTAELCEAASDFLRTSAEKTEWAKKGIVTESSFNEYYETLVRQWDAERKIVKLAYSYIHDGVQLGSLVYNNCRKNVLQLRLQGCAVPSFFGSGTLHTLANDPVDAPLIGWHPDYKELLNREEKNENE